MVNIRTDPKYFFRQQNSFDFPEVLDVKHVWEALAKKDELLRKRVAGRQIDKTANISGAHIAGPVHIGKNTVVKPFTHIEATEQFPTYIGDECTIGPFAYIRKGTLIGNRVEIFRTDVKGSVILNAVKSHHHGYVGDSVIGYGVNIATAFDSGNLKHTGGTIKINSIDTKLKKFGCVIGDYSKTGCKNTTAPGTLIGPNVWLDSDLYVGGFIPENTFRRWSPEGTVIDKVLAENYRNLGTLVE